MSAAVLGALGVSSIVNRRINPRDLIYSAVAGGIAGGAPSFFTSNIVYALVVGCTAGMFQAFFQSVVEKRFVRTNGPLTTISLTLFLFQG